ncbi:7TM diverse intracellular signaling domain-containing protein [Nibrella saemangeumensis]
MRLLIVYGILSIMGTGTPLAAQPGGKLVYADSQSLLELGRHVRIYKDPSATLNIDQVRRLPDSLFEASRQDVLNFGLTRARIWLKVTLQNQAAEPLYLLFRTQDINAVDAYITGPAGSSVFHTGTYRPFRNRYFLTNSVVLKLGDAPTDIYIAVQEGSRFHFPILLGSIQPIVQHQYRETLFNGAILGIMLVMAFINFCIYLMLRDRTYLFYCCYVLTSGLMFMMYEGLTYDLFWRSFPWLNDDRFSFVTRVLTFVFGILFSTRFLHLDQYLPRLNQFFKGVVGLLLVVGFLKIANLSVAETIFYPLTLFGLVSLFTAGVLTFRAGYRPARYYLVGWGLYILGAMSTILALMDVLSFKYLLTAYGYASGAACEATVLSFALADRLNSFRKENLRSQQLAIAQLQENERLVREQNRLLEEKVAERTQALQHSVDELELKNAEILRQQSELEEVRLKNLRAEFARKLARIKLKSLRDQMNPHFLFNCMNTIEAYIIENRPDEATAFLQKFSKLIRATLENSLYESIPIKSEIEALNLYIQLEEARVNNRFSHTVDVSPVLLEQPYTIPPLLLQPYVENAILHGLRHKRDTAGQLRIGLSVQDQRLICTIEDNGIGRQKAAEMRTSRPGKSQSLGMKFTGERMAVMSEISATRYEVEVIDLIGNGQTGTKVILTLPLLRQTETPVS